jgi:futalosine hydrolase
MVKEPLYLLIVAATEMEWKPTLTYLKKRSEQLKPGTYQFGNLHIQFLETGPGIPDSIYRLTKALNLIKRPDVVVHVGIAGAFNKDVALGTVFAVGSDRFADLGAQTADGGFLDLFELGLAGSNQLPYRGGKLLPVAPEVPLPDLPVATAITVNTVSGTDRRIDQLRTRYPADLESMEGAAVFYVCGREQLPVMALRAVSNWVEPRNRDAWKIGLAVTNLNDALCQWLEELSLWAVDH